MKVMACLMSVSAQIPGTSGEGRSNGMRLERSGGWVMTQALAAWGDREEERHRMTLEALEDVDPGWVIDHQAIQAWARQS